MPQHPYSVYEKLKIWKSLEKAIGNLEKNGDIARTTPVPYIVGYIISLLDKENLLKEELNGISKKESES